MIPEAVIEAGARALRIEEMDDVVPPGFAARQWDEGVADREKPMRLARAARPIVQPRHQHRRADQAVARTAAQRFDAVPLCIAG